MLFVDDFKFMNLRGEKSLNEFLRFSQNDTKLKHIIKLFKKLIALKQVDNEPESSQSQKSTSSKDRTMMNFKSQMAHKQYNIKHKLKELI